ncbi:MAG: 3-phosphoshikimate 1-carboxyvinyltransferase [Lachnospiraceae bacterium]|nr:3-phosphoshikimate 1-carboxyvinyltransferase [Lachnospiraceae bacterium]
MAYVSVPGSKSITNRALLLAALSDGRCKLNGVLFSDDSRHFLKCLVDLGFDVSINEEEREVLVRGLGGAIPKSEGSVYVGSAGTAARFIAALLGISDGVYTLDSSEQMKKRPMKPLLAALRSMGTDITYHGEEGFFPFTLDGRGADAREIAIDIGDSSQFLSALLISSVCFKDGLTIHVKGSHGMSYIEMTVKMMEQFGVKVLRPDESTFVVEAGQHYHLDSYDIEPDMSAAAYFYAAAAILKTSTVVRGVKRVGLQGDVKLFDVLENMGCEVHETAEGVLVKGPEVLRGVDVDMREFSDQAITVACTAVFATGQTKITGIGHIRHQESDRIHGIATELSRMGIEVLEGDDYLVITPGCPKSAAIETYDDHRMAMGFSLVGLRAEGIEILNPMCCRKTFENYFEVLDKFIDDLR